jgi:predicted acyltransferase
MSTPTEPVRVLPAETAATEAAVKGTILEKAPRGRLLSLDAFRGFIMMVLISSGFGLGYVVLPNHPGYAWIARQFDHVPWKGMALWDLIQPSFMFMVGLAMPFSFGRRKAQGETFEQQFLHVLWRCFILLLLSHILTSISPEGDYPKYTPHFELDNVLAQIAFTYFFAFLIMQLEFRWQIVAAVVFLAVHWGLFVALPGANGPFSMQDNIGMRIDRAILHHNAEGYYVSINWISSTVTNLLGVWCGLLMMKRRSHAYNVKVLAGGAALCFLLGFALTPVNPMVKRIWTESFTLVSGGCVLLILLFFYWLVEIMGFRRLVFPLLVLGMNSIFVYSVHMIMTDWINDVVGTFTRGFRFIGPFAPVAQSFCIFLVMWYLCYWLYQHKIFFRI